MENVYLKIVMQNNDVDNRREQRSNNREGRSECRESDEERTKTDEIRGNKRPLVAAILS